MESKASMSSTDLFSPIDQKEQGVNRGKVLIPISMFEHIRPVNDLPDWVMDDVPRPHYPDWQDIIDWQKFVTLLMRWSTYRFRKKSDAPLFSPTVFTPPRRAMVNATICGLIVVDADNGLLFDSAIQRLREGEIEAVIHTSGSNVAGDKFRIIVPILSPVRIDVQRAAVAAFCRFLYDDTTLHADLGKMNGYSLFYIPAIYEKVYRGENENGDPIWAVVNNRFEYLVGDIFEARDWIAAFPAPPKPERPSDYAVDLNIELSRDVQWDPDETAAIRRYQSLGPGEHHAGLYGMLKGLAQSAYNKGYDLQADELADIVWDRRGPANHYTYGQIKDKCADAIAEAPQWVTDPWFRRVKEPPGRWINEPDWMMAEVFGKKQSVENFVAELAADLLRTI
jgi:hypothetical protein